MRIGLVGSGSMARALALGWGEPVLCTDAGSGRAQALAADVGGQAVGSNRELAERADVVVTMGCGDACPYIPGKRYVDWDLEDPKGRPVEAVRASRETIAARVRTLVAELDAAHAPASPVDQRMSARVDDRAGEGAGREGERGAD